VCFAARPLAVFVTTPSMALTPSQRRLAAWFGVRGIGSMYYLAFAVSHGVDGAQLKAVADAVLVTVALSVLMHGSSATPIMRLYRRTRPPRPLPGRALQAAPGQRPGPSAGTNSPQDCSCPASAPQGGSRSGPAEPDPRTPLDERRR
jgi:NhaP-type Na+/H+ or K+/H+ antiporter